MNQNERIRLASLAEKLIQAISNLKVKDEETRDLRHVHDGLQKMIDTLPK